MVAAGSLDGENVHEVLASTVRRRILTACRVPHSVAALAKEMGLTRQATHRHVAMLLEQGLLVATAGTDRRKVEYRMDPAGLQTLLQRMDSNLRKLGEGLSVSVTRPLREEPGAIGQGGVGLVCMHEGGVAWVPLDASRPNVIGRKGNVPGLPEDPFQSGRHACVELVDGSWQVRDLGSRNGTIHNGEKVGIGQAVALEDGDFLRLGVTGFRFMPSAVG